MVDKNHPVSFSAPCYHCNLTNPQFGKEQRLEKEPGFLHLQAGTVRLNSVSTSELAFALKNLRVGRAFPLHRAQPQYIDFTFDRLIRRG